MSKEERRVPELRFKGFHDDWEQRKLNDISTFYSGGTPAATNKHYYNGNIPFVRSAEINRDKTELTISHLGLKESSAKLVAKGDILYALYGATSGEVAISNIDGAINQAILVLKLYNKYDEYFVFQWLRKSKSRIVSKFIQGGQGNLSSSIIKNLHIDIPIYTQEQQIIGEFLKELDKVITLHQRKVNILSIIKRNLLMKLFPKKEEALPKLRFQGYKEKWKRYKLGDKTYFYSGLTYSPKDLVKKGGVFVIRSSNINHNIIVDSDNVYVNPQIVNAQPVKINDIIVVVRNGSRALIGKHAIVKKDMDNTVIGVFMTGLRSHEPDFTNALLDTQHFKREIHKNLGATINQITTGIFKKMIFSFPDSDEEKRIIGKLIRVVDDIIALHDRESELLLKLKQSYLRKMFI